jgi:hypothetical protein
LEKSKTRRKVVALDLQELILRCQLYQKWRLVGTEVRVNTEYMAVLDKRNDPSDTAAMQSSGLSRRSKSRRKVVAPDIEELMLRCRLYEKWRLVGTEVRVNTEYIAVLDKRKRLTKPLMNPMTLRVPCEANARNPERFSVNSFRITE